PLAPTANKRHHQNVGIQRQRPIADIVNIVAKSLFEAGVAPPAVDLRVAGNAGPDGMAEIVAAMFFAELSGKFRTLGAGTDEAHVAAQHIPELRQFVKAGAPEKISDSSAARIIGNRPDGAQIALG